MRHRYTRRKNENNSLIRILIILAVLTSLGGIVDVGLGILDLLFAILGLGIALAAIAAPFVGLYFILKSIFSPKSKSKTRQRKTKAATSTIDSTELLKQLSKYFQNNEVINIDEETYITITDKDNINLKTIDIYMREEYIGTLQDYLTAYPNAYNELANLLKKYLEKKDKESRRSRKSSNEKTNIVESQPASTKKEEKPQQKGAAYYADLFEKLNAQNPNENITEGLNETCKYLKSIQKIEDDFPDSRSKTEKLYEYYLPMLTDILSNYNRLSASTTNPEDFKASEDRLLKTIVLINGALKTISSGLLEDYYSEINVDMRTLESILKKDGLVEDFKQEG